jgi:Ser/Thr protein kinase RdoA (MazF antagonist)
MAIKAKSIALCFDTKILLEKLDQTNPSKTLTNEGFILSDFNLKYIRIRESDNGILLLTAFQNIKFSFFLNDLAICQADFILAKCFTENGDSWKKFNHSILKGYETKFKLDNLEIRLLNRLIAFNLIFQFLKSEVENQSFDLNKFTEVFEFFYLDENLTF